MANRKHRKSVQFKLRSNVGRHARLGMSVAAAGTFMLGGPIFAADDAGVAATKKDQTLEEVIVTGLRKSLETAQAIKQKKEQIVDSVTAQDIGALPDRSVSEALQRIPGITLQRTNENRDPARLASEGGGVFIRGLSWVRSETNGRDIFSANNGRALSYEDVSADLLAGIDVYKNPSAELIEGGIGGIVNLRTRQPFDSNKRLLAASADVNYADLYKRGFISGTALYSDSWDTGVGRIGALISVSIGNVGNRTDSIQTGRYEPHAVSASEATSTGLTEGSTVYMPNSYGWRRIDWKQRREALSASLQWAPNDKSTFTFQALMAQADPKDIEHTLGDDNDFGETEIPVSGNVYNSQGVVTKGTTPFSLLTADTRYGQSHKTTSDFSLNGKFIPNDRWAFSGDLQYVTSHADVLSLTAFTQNSQAGALSFDLGGDTPSLKFTQTPDVSGDMSAYWWAAAMDHLEKNDAKSWAQRADAEVTFDDNPWLKSFRFGVRATEKKAITRETGWNWSLLSHEFWCGCGPAVYMNSGPASANEFVDYKNFFRGSVGVPGVGWFPSAQLVSNGTAYAYSILHATETSGWGWTPLSNDFSQAHPGADNVNGGVNNQHENTQAAYMLLRFGNGTGKGAIDGNVGVRLVHTFVDASGLLTNFTLQNGSPQTCADAATAGAGMNPPLAIDCAAYDQAYAFSQGGNVPGFSQTNTYNDILPSFNIRFMLRDDLQLRFALSRAMVRPTFSQMQAYTTLGAGFNALYQSTTGLTGTGGNPKLKPTRADQFDASLEWYFAPVGSLTFATFYKDVRNYIFLGESQETYTSNGQTLTFDVTRNLNGAHGRIAGFELGYQQIYDFLPGALGGLGTQFNYTYVSSSGGRNTAININEPAQVNGASDQTLPLEGLSRKSFNAALIYEKYGISARLAYNWRERYLLTTSAANIQRPVWSEDFGQLDGSVFYSLTSHVKVGLQGTNLLNSRTFLDVGGATLAPRYSWTDTDRRIAAAVRVSL